MNEERAMSDASAQQRSEQPLEERIQQPIEQRLADTREDAALDLVLDANALGGTLAAIFGGDVTASPGRCAHCHTVSLVGSMRAYTRGPGMVLRCPACAEVVVRVVEAPTGTYVDLTGITTLRLPRA
jgi:hypothetical protein